MNRIFLSDIPPAGVLLAVFLTVMLIPIQEAAAQGYSCGGSARYAAANGGSGSSCSSGSPCSLSAAIKAAGSGGTVVLQSGRYSASGLSTQGGNFTLCAENRHKAEIYNGGSNHTIFINDNGVTIKGLHFTGPAGGGAGGSVGMIRVGAASNIVIEDNIVENAATGQISIGGSSPGARISSVVVRNNLLRNSGLAGKEGEAIYVGSVQDSGGVTVSDVTIVGNVIENFTANAIDNKKTTRNVNIHHNVFNHHNQTRDPNHQVGGTIVMNGRDIQVHDNVFLDARNAGSWGIFAVAGNANNRVFKNVVNGSGPNASAVVSELSRGHSEAVSQVYNNTFCNLSSYADRTGSGVNVHDNVGMPGGAPGSACQAEEQRIRSEMGNAGSIVINGPCHILDSSKPVYQGYGAAYNVHSPQKELLLAAVCEQQGIDVLHGNGDAMTYVYHAGYVWNGSNWVNQSYSCGGQKIVDAWCVGKASGKIPAAAQWYVAHTCWWSGTQWKCGCRDAACGQSFWQLQGIQ